MWEMTIRNLKHKIQVEESNLKSQNQKQKRLKSQENISKNIQNKT